MGDLAVVRYQVLLLLVLAHLGKEITEELAVVFQENTEPVVVAVQV
jgi:hypothetical protein